VRPFLVAVGVDGVNTTSAGERPFTRNWSPVTKWPRPEPARWMHVPQSSRGSMRHARKAYVHPVMSWRVDDSVADLAHRCGISFGVAASPSVAPRSQPGSTSLRTRAMWRAIAPESGRSIPC